MEKKIKNINGKIIKSWMKKKYLIAISLIIIGIISRIYLRNFLPPAPPFHINLMGISQPIFIPGDVFFMIAIISLIAGRYLGGIFSFSIPFLIMLITDILIKNNFIFLFTWSGFIMLGCFGYLMQKKSLYKFIALSIPSVIAYDLWTNFGWWLGGYYGYNLNVLILWYVLAIPFMTWHLISTIAFLPIFSLPFEKLETRKIEEIKYAKYVTISSTIFAMLFSFVSIL